MELKLKKRLIIGMLTLITVCFSVFAIYYFLQHLMIMGIIIVLLILFNLLSCVIIITKSIEESLHYIYGFLCNIGIIFNALVLLHNGSWMICTWFFALPIGIRLITNGKIAFIYALIAFCMFLITCCLKYYFSALNIIIIKLTQEQVEFVNAATFLSFFAIFIYSFFCVFQLEKFKNQSEKLEKEISTDARNKEWEKYRIIYAAAINAMEQEKLYENPDLTLVEFAEHLNTNQSYIYRAFKQNNVSENFPNFVNKYRINAIKEKIDKGENEKFTLGHLYQACGFRQQSTFNKIFKQFEGITPSEYIALKKLRERKKNEGA